MCYGSWTFRVSNITFAHVHFQPMFSHSTYEIFSLYGMNVDGSMNIYTAQFKCVYTKSYAYIQIHNSHLHSHILNVLMNSTRVIFPHELIILAPIIG